ncbi:hypothetical protein DQ400_15665 [Vreelandella sulfidaeris]|jgi:hypothetical protein|uniref:Uncharacterized protein n=2 Tax=Vreelandella TaxID=3137766 RepID=A0A365TK73_9GAMM|nr:MULTISPECIES: hypothetical protein [Halomonas]RBI66175.1 hypothetical protein DQ400_15665 [Halomonas sulfidaeris]|tara:strand:- start:1637 stop:2050 length:414 start_codon:yes stop_codon:yes gene_type:complete
MQTLFKAALIIVATTMPLFANAQEGDNEPAHQLYGGHDAGALLSKSLMVTSQLDWLNAWSLNLGGNPPEDLPQGYIGVLVFASYPGHLISLHPLEDSSSLTIRCHQAPLPDSRSYIAPAAWAAGMFRADSVTLEDCP